MPLIAPITPTVTITVGGQTFDLPNPAAQARPDPMVALLLAIVRELGNVGNGIAAHCVAIDHLASTTLSTDHHIRQVLLQIRANAAAVLAQLKGSAAEPAGEPGNSAGEPDPDDNDPLPPLEIQ